MIAPKVSVCVPTYNRAATLRGTIEAVLHQTYEDWELVICDDGSTDNTVEVVGDYQDKRIRYQRNDVKNLLLQIINPSAQIREGYETMNIETRDGRSLTGFLADKDNQIVLLRSPDGQTVAIQRKEIVEMNASGTSLMPEGLLEPLTDQQLRDFFAYVRSSQPLVGKNPEE